MGTVVDRPYKEKRLYRKSEAKALMMSKNQHSHSVQAYNQTYYALYYILY